MTLNRPPQRIVVHSKDVENITGYMPRSARKLLQKIREASGKPKGAFVSVHEFCRYTGLNEEHVRAFMEF